jgi:hypothetical protein
MILAKKFKTIAPFVAQKNLCCYEGIEFMITVKPFFKPSALFMKMIPPKL